MPLENPKRFEVSLPAAQRAALEQLAEEAGVSSAGLARLAIARMLNDPTSLTGRKQARAEAA